MKTYICMILVLAVFIGFVPAYTCKAGQTSDDYFLSFYIDILHPEAAVEVQNMLDNVLIEGYHYYVYAYLWFNHNMKLEIFDTEHNLIESVTAEAISGPASWGDRAIISLDNYAVGSYTAEVTIGTDVKETISFVIMEKEYFAAPVVSINKYFYDSPIVPVEYSRSKNEMVRLVEGDKYCFNFAAERETKVRVEIFYEYSTYDEALQTHEIDIKMNDDGIYAASLDFVPPTSERPHYKVKVTTMDDNAINTSVSFFCRYYPSKYYNFYENGNRQPSERYLDVAPTDPLYENLVKLARMGALGCFNEAYFYPDKIITRAEYASMLVEAFDISTSDEAYEKIGEIYNFNPYPFNYIDAKNRFNDIDRNSWYYPYVYRIAGYMFDVEGKFLPDAGAQRWDIMVTLLNIHNPAYTFNSQSTEGWYLSPDYASEIRAVYSDISDGWWIDQYIWLAYTHSFMDGYPDGTFRFDEYVTRAEAVNIICKVLEF